jgi:hypothetical protein
MVLKFFTYIIMKNTKRKNNYRKKNSKSGIKSEIKSEIKSRRKKKIFKQKGGTDLSKLQKRIGRIAAWYGVRETTGLDDIEEDRKAIAEAKKNTEIVKFMKSIFHSQVEPDWGLYFTHLNNNWVVRMLHTEVTKKNLSTISDPSDDYIEIIRLGGTLYKYQTQIIGLSLGKLYPGDVVVKIIGPNNYEKNIGRENIDIMLDWSKKTVGKDGFYEITLVIDIDKSHRRSFRESGYLSNDDVEIILKNKSKYTESFHFGFDFDDSFIVNGVDNPDVKAWRKVEQSPGSDKLKWSEWHDSSMRIEISKKYKIKKVNAESLDGKKLDRGDLELIMNQKKFLKLRLTPTNLRADPNSPIVEASMDQQVEIKKKPQEKLGLRIAKRRAENYAVVTYVISGSKAANKRIGINDIITEINGVSLREKDIDEVNKLIQSKTDLILLGKFKNIPVPRPVEEKKHVQVIKIDPGKSYRSTDGTVKLVNPKGKFILEWDESISAYTVTKSDPDNLLKVGEVITSITGFSLRDKLMENDTWKLNPEGNVALVKVNNQSS